MRKKEAEKKEKTENEGESGAQELIVSVTYKNCQVDVYEPLCAIDQLKCVKTIPVHGTPVEIPKLETGNRKKL